MITVEARLTQSGFLGELAVWRQDELLHIRGYAIPGHWVALRVAVTVVLSLAGLIGVAFFSGYFAYLWAAALLFHLLSWVWFWKRAHLREITLVRGSDPCARIGKFWDRSGWWLILLGVIGVIAYIMHARARTETLFFCLAEKLEPSTRIPYRLRSEDARTLVVLKDFIAGEAPDIGSQLNTPPVRP